MTLNDLNTIAQTLGVVALVVSLVFVGYQLRQNAKHTRAQIQSARVDRLMAQMIGFSDADKCAAYIRGNGREPTPEAIQDRQFYMQCLAQLGMITDVFHQHRDGLLSDEQFAGAVETYKRWLAEPGFYRIAMDFRTRVLDGTPVISAFLDTLLPREMPAPPKPTT
ncbi:MAG TPA: hypothetical protein VGO52_22260 [Hyphomonadaceae bacterium]|jgi:hypothetical protein|nr:hypothetical protein [Hyphomonadaceae bacterium]